MKKLMQILLILVILFYLWICWELSIPGTGERESGIGDGLPQSTQIQ